jgi:hypothetical protein
MPATYEPIATTTLGSATNTITFSSITSSYTDLRVVLTVVGVSATADALIKLNNESSGLVSSTYLSANGSTAASGEVRNNAFAYLNLGADLSGQALFTIDIFSYSGSTFKTFLSTFSNNRNGSGYVNRQVNLYRSTSAINRIDLYLLSARTFSAGTIATLYGIKAA